MEEKNNEDKVEPTKFKLVERTSLKEISSEHLRPEIKVKNSWLYPEDGIDKIKQGMVSGDEEKRTNHNKS
jgi:hypothetical protein